MKEAGWDIFCFWKCTLIFPFVISDDGDSGDVGDDDVRPLVLEHFLLFLFTEVMRVKCAMLFVVLLEHKNGPWLHTFREKDFASFAYLKMVFKVSFRGLNCDPIKLILEEHDV